MMNKGKHKKIKILFSCVGRRVELVQAFRNAAIKLNQPVEIWATDMSDTAPAIVFCDKYEKMERIDSPTYPTHLYEICKRNDIDAVVPTIDTDLLLLSRNKEKFEEIGTKIIVSDEEQIKICRDKRLTEKYFRSIGLNCPKTIDDINDYNLGFPAFIKPKDGSSSIMAYKVNDKETLETYANFIPNYIIQPFIDGEEYTVDVFCDFNSNPLYITPRLRCSTRSGEVLKTQIVKDDKIVEEVKTFVKNFKPIGAITLQLIKEKNTDENYYIEINPRYGGGAPLSIKAGANSAEALLCLLRGEKPNIHYASQSVYSRFDQSVCLTSDLSSIKAVIFDLDDTLYDEKDYVKSGFIAVAKILPSVKDCEEKLWNAFISGKKAIDYVLSEENIYTEDLKAKCVTEYREHFPNISLSDSILTTIKVLRDKGIKIGIITDGRPSGQRNKIKALGLEDLVDEIIITDELGGEKFRKPNDIAFRIMQIKMGVDFSEMLYVGDNINKDFYAPRQLGMQALVFNNPNGIYSFKDQDGYLKLQSLNAICELLTVLEI